MLSHKHYYATMHGFCVCNCISHGRSLAPKRCFSPLHQPSLLLPLPLRFFSFSDLNFFSRSLRSFAAFPSLTTRAFFSGDISFGTCMASTHSCRNRSNASSVFLLSDRVFWDVITNSPSLVIRPLFNSSNRVLPYLTWFDGNPEKNGKQEAVSSVLH